MTRQEARMILLEDALEHAVGQVEFLHGCLTDPEGYNYLYPWMSDNIIKEARKLVSSAHAPCVHSRITKGCESCIDGQIRRTRHQLALESYDEYP